MSTWPSTLPPLRLPVEKTRQSGVIRTSMDAGPDKVRRRFSAVSKFYRFPLRMTGAQLTTLETFFADTLAEGSLPFTMNDPYTDVSDEFRFLEPPSSNAIVGSSDPNQRIFDVRVQIERLP